ncbi:MAG: hypothetical protein OXU69_03380 [Gemmatimonadota bacterium]|nr:hypothetical protein [Gemmatimonadota bacterium]
MDMPVIPIDPQALNVRSPVRDALCDVRDVLVVDDTIWAPTASAPYVLGFGPTVKLTARFGNGGQGPGKFCFPSAIWPDRSSGSLTVWDSGSSPALTFSAGGALLSYAGTALRGAIRSDIGTVTFGDPFRAVPVPDGLVVARYDSGVNHGRDLWNGRLVYIPDDGGDARVLVDFASDLPGAAHIPTTSLLAPVPLWDGCPDERIAVLDPVFRSLFMVNPAQNERALVTLPWHPGARGTDACIAYKRSRVEAEIDRGSVSEAEIDCLAAEAAANLADLFAQKEPIAVDLKCAPDRVWIQRFEGSDPLGCSPPGDDSEPLPGIPGILARRLSLRLHPAPYYRVACLRHGRRRRWHAAPRDRPSPTVRPSTPAITIYYPSHASSVAHEPGRPQAMKNKPTWILIAFHTTLALLPIVIGASEGRAQEPRSAFFHYCKKTASGRPTVVTYVASSSGTALPPKPVKRREQPRGADLFSP